MNDLRKIEYLTMILDWLFPSPEFGGELETDRECGQHLANDIEAGCVYSNQLTKSDPRVLFGGIGESGYGRELSEVGIEEFVKQKTVWVE